MEETEAKIKRTDKVKKTSFGGFYAEYGKWDIRGKSSKEVKLMFQDVRNCVTHQLVRIKKLKYVLELYKKNDKTKKLLQAKLRTNKVIENKNLINRRLKYRTKKVEELDQEVSELELQIKNQEKEIAKLNRQLDKKDEVMHEVKSIKRKAVIKEVKQPLSPEARRLERIANNGVSDVAVRTLEYVSRTANFCKDKRITLDYLSLISQIELLGNVKTNDVSVSYQILNRLTERGFLSTSHGTGTSAKYWFVSPDGKQLLKDYKNNLIYGKSILT